MITTLLVLYACFGCYYAGDGFCHYRNRGVDGVRAFKLAVSLAFVYPIVLLVAWLQLRNEAAAAEPLDPSDDPADPEELK